MLVFGCGYAVDQSLKHWKENRPRSRPLDWKAGGLPLIGPVTSKALFSLPLISSALPDYWRWSRGTMCPCETSVVFLCLLEGDVFFQTALLQLLPSYTVERDLQALILQNNRHLYVLRLITCFFSEQFADGCQAWNQCVEFSSVVATPVLGLWRN